MLKKWVSVTLKMPDFHHEFHLINKLLIDLDVGLLCNRVVPSYVWKGTMLLTFGILVLSNNKRILSVLSSLLHN